MPDGDHAFRKGAEGSKPLYRLTVSPEAHSTILAALRYWQARDRKKTYGQLQMIEDIATNGGEHEALSDADIDGLCEDINCCERVA